MSVPAYSTANVEPRLRSRDRASGYQKFGFSPVLWIGLGTLLAGIPLMFWWQTRDGAFFRVKTDPIDTRPPPEGGQPLPQLVPEDAPR